MKAHRFKTKLTTQDEVWKEWNNELLQKVDNKIFEIIGQGNGILAYAEFKNSSEYRQLFAYMKLAQMKEWERKGRNLAFLKNYDGYNFMDLLELKHFGKIVT